MATEETEVECTANRGRTYKVTFDAAGNVRRVQVKVWLSGGLDASRHTWRMLWDHESSKPMSITAACAARAAIAKRANA